MITVYYGIKPLPNKNASPIMNMLEDSLVNVYQDLKKTSNKNIPNSGSMFSCRSFLQYTKNLYMMTNPVDINVRVEKSKVFNLGDRSLDDLFFNRALQVDDVYNLNYMPGYIFFSETSLEIEILSPFMHKSSFCNNGYIVPGSYDISKWFRAVNPALQFYNNLDKSIKSDKGDPLMYINFKTHDNVKLKRFYMTKELEDIASGTTSYKKYDPNRSLSYLYDKFTSGGLNKRTLKLIKENLV